MNSNVDASKEDLVESSCGEPEDYEQSAGQPSGTRASSAQTILLWRSYLPEDCVNTMIKMGWHQTT